jgi:hypothetical protein
VSATSATSSGIAGTAISTRNLKGDTMPSKIARDKWNAEHYTHINIAIDKQLAVSFKDNCRRNGASVAGTIVSFIREHLGLEKVQGNPSPMTTSLSTRACRRNELDGVIDTLEKILDAEEGYLDRIPENLQGSSRAETATHSIDMLSDAIDTLRDAY